MNIYFIVIQLTGIIAWLFLVLSYHRKKVKHILLFQIIGNILWILQYFLLGAYSGMFICFCDIICNYLYSKTDRKKLIYIVSVPIRIIGGMLCYSKAIDVLSILASLVDGYFLTLKRKKIILGGILAYILWLIYDICVLSISGAVTDIILLISNFSILVFNFNIFDMVRGVLKGDGLLVSDND